MDVLHHREKVVRKADFQVWALIELRDGLLEEFLVIMIDKYGLIVQLVSGRQKLMLLAVIELFEVFANALLLFAFFEVKI